jgi:hypothetical protein
MLLKALNIVVVIAATFLVAPSAYAAAKIEVFVALADNESQGIVPVPDELGDGSNPRTNLYWGALYGVKTYFSRSPAWQRTNCANPEESWILERCEFVHKSTGATLTAHAYEGLHIPQAIKDYLEALTIENEEDRILTAYIGHNGLMEFRPPPLPLKINLHAPDAIILACSSRDYFEEWLHEAGAPAILWTTGLMAPEAYSLHDAIDAWLKEENATEIADAAAAAYAKYQKISTRSARRLLISGSD